MRKNELLYFIAVRWIDKFNGRLLSSKEILRFRQECTESNLSQEEVILFMNGLNRRDLL